MNDMELFLTTFGGTGAALLIAGFVAKTWIGKRIESAIEFEYSKKMAEYERELQKRDRSALVADLLSEWMRTEPGKNMNPDVRKKLNQLSFEAVLWFPAKLAVELSDVLQKKEDALTTQELLLKIRKHLGSDGDLVTDNVTYWGRDHENKEEMANKKNH